MNGTKVKNLLLYLAILVSVILLFRGSYRLFRLKQFSSDFQITQEAGRIHENLLTYCEKSINGLLDESLHSPENDSWFSTTVLLDENGKLKEGQIDNLSKRSTRVFVENNKRLLEEKVLINYYKKRQNIESDERHSDLNFFWYTGYQNQNLQIFHTQKLSSGYRLSSMNTAYFYSKMMVELFRSQPALGKTYVALLSDSFNVPLFQWGEGDVESKQFKEILRAPLAEPFNMWHLTVYSLNKNNDWISVFTHIASLIVSALLIVFTVFLLLTSRHRAIRQAERRVSFVNRVSHEFKTPLTNISLYSELSQMHLEKKDEKVTAYLGVIRSEVQRLSRMVNNVLGFGKSEKDKLELNASTLTWHSFYKEVKSLQPEQDVLTINYHLQTNSDEDEKVAIDKDALIQVVQNIVSNAQKYAAGGGRLDVDFFRAAESYCISFRDYGPGVKKSQLKHLFDPFFRAEHDGLEAVNGTGIGLSISREIARKHGGDLTVEAANEGPGLCFILCFRELPYESTHR